MNASEEIKFRNVEKIFDVIVDNVESVVIAGVTVCKSDSNGGYYAFESGHLTVFGDNLEVDGPFVYLEKGDVCIAMLYLGRE